MRVIIALTFMCSVGFANYYVKGKGLLLEAQASGFCSSDYQFVLKNLSKDKGPCHLVKTFQVRDYGGSLGKVHHLSGNNPPLCTEFWDVFSCDDSVPTSVFSGPDTTIISTTDVQALYDLYEPQGKSISRRERDVNGNMILNAVVTSQKNRPKGWDNKKLKTYTTGDEL